MMTGFGTAEARPIRHVGPGELRRLELPSGSMGPKVETACPFVEQTGRFAAIGALEDAQAILRGESGTIVTGLDGVPIQAP